LTGQTFTVERQLADWSLGTGGFDTLRSFLGAALKLRTRLKSEAARRNQPLPKINIP
jgi:hypothetical protein